MSDLKKLFSSLFRNKRKDSKAIAKAEERFKKLTAVGFTAAVRTTAGEVSQIRSFDPTAVGG